MGKKEKNALLWIWKNVSEVGGLKPEEEILIGKSLGKKERAKGCSQKKTKIITDRIHKEKKKTDTCEIGREKYLTKNLKGENL